ncbi:hypothetical protein KAM380_059410 [Aeromonas caviae]|nr:hypothetical protein KAM380_059410 [Aeromonas caviae]
MDYGRKNKDSHTDADAFRLGLSYLPYDPELLGQLPMNAEALQLGRGREFRAGTLMEDSRLA